LTILRSLRYHHGLKTYEAEPINFFYPIFESSDLVHLLLSTIFELDSHSVNIVTFFNFFRWSIIVLCYSFSYPKNLSGLSRLQRQLVLVILFWCLRLWIRSWSAGLVIIDRARSKLLHRSLQKEYRFRTITKRILRSKYHRANVQGTLDLVWKYKLALNQLYQPDMKHLWDCIEPYSSSFHE